MKKVTCFVLAICAAVTLSFCAQAHAGWVLYDDFNSGTIDPDLWTVWGSSAIVSIQNGKAKFVHQPGHVGLSTFLLIKTTPNLVKGIRATITVKSSKGDLRARVAGFIGKINEDYVFQQICVQPAVNKIWADLDLETAGTFASIYSLFRMDFRNPMSLAGKVFTVTAIFSDPKKVNFATGGLGTVTAELPRAMAKSDNHFMGVGTRSSSGDGSGVVYFDNVYVLY